tara:strand:- start:1012 stop:2427 length:1416 start_codon:yes stop_codon:yes gene_type:complete
MAETHWVQAISLYDYTPDPSQSTESNPILSLTKNEIIHVVPTTGAAWWWSSKINSDTANTETSITGLIPSNYVKVMNVDIDDPNYLTEDVVPYTEDQVPQDIDHSSSYSSDSEEENEENEKEDQKDTTTATTTATATDRTSIDVTIHHVPAISLYDYEGDEVRHVLSLSIGDKLHVVNDPNREWWDAVMDDGSGHVGLVPHNYVRVLEEEAEQEEMARQVLQHVDTKTMEKKESLSVAASTNNTNNDIQKKIISRNWPSESVIDDGGADSIFDFRTQRKQAKVLYDYDATHDTGHNVLQNEIVWVSDYQLNNEENSEWIKVYKNITGEPGFVPRNYIIVIENQTDVDTKRKDMDLNKTDVGTTNTSDTTSTNANNNTKMNTKMNTNISTKKLMKTEEDELIEASKFFGVEVSNAPSTKQTAARLTRRRMSGVRRRGSVLSNSSPTSSRNNRFVHLFNYFFYFFVSCPNIYN